MGPDQTPATGNENRTFCLLCTVQTVLLYCQGMSVEQKGKPASARERLLDAANELFYEDGVHTVGVDRVVERAGVAKATLYTQFGNKDGLVRAYLVARDEAIRERITRELDARYRTPRE